MNMFEGLDVFNSLPYWDSASMFVNKSETCATRKLLQCRDMGIYMNDVWGKFSGDEIPDLPKDHFAERKRVVEAVEKWMEENKGTENDMDWTPILYNFEVAKASAKRNQDWGHLVFTDPTLSRFLLVMCFGPDKDGHGHDAHDHYLAITKYHADRFFSLAKYVFAGRPEPTWVRATYTTFTSSINPLFLNSQDPQVPEGTHPPIYQATPETFTPYLTEGELERIDSTIMQSKRWKVPPANLRDAVLARGPRPKPLHTTWLCGRSAEVCGNCGEVATAKMPQCAVCKIVRYCNRECQRAHWPTHKKYCRKNRD
ncbi:zinc finger MYND domain-containing protein [Phanerochaete sordida]|uniref:Zinc finger MYND domain-containing protein n=1 Tax=Phanerochaete sordida TaxID=48140 RepID=A0A9P3G1F9_9APHY|nr:zinc finger MYND domain-containing protein [Phanerochaete sordida]